MADEIPLTPAELAAREDAALRAFLAPQETTIGKITLRPISLTSLFQLRRMAFSRPSAEAGEAPDNLWQMMVFAYIHAAPEKEVARSIFNRALFDENVQAFCAAIPADHLSYLLECSLARFVDIDRLEFAIKPKPKENSPGPTPPPN